MITDESRAISNKQWLSWTISKSHMAFNEDFIRMYQLNTCIAEPIIYLMLQQDFSKKTMFHMQFSSKSISWTFFWKPMQEKVKSLKTDLLCARFCYVYSSHITKDGNLWGHRSRPWTRIWKDSTQYIHTPCLSAGLSAHSPCLQSSKSTNTYIRHC